MNKLATNSEFWDEWQQAAVAAGVAGPLAELGCEVLRAHRKNRWSKEFLGVEDDGPFMLELCLRIRRRPRCCFWKTCIPTMPNCWLPRASVLG